MIGQKLEILRKVVARVRVKCPDTAEALSRDEDAQDAVVLGLTRAVQLCVDLGAHIISGLEKAAPTTMGQTFDILSDAGIILPDLALRMKQAVGFRNLAVHNYDTINWSLVHSIAQSRTTDFEDFARAIAAVMDGE